VKTGRRSSHILGDLDNSLGLILDEFDTPGMDDEEALKEKDYMSAPEVVNELKKIDDAKQENIADILKKAREA
jgi:hypothetical protein